MSRGVNKVILMGRVGKDPEVKYMPSGGAVVNLTIATSEEWKDKQTGEKQERTEWHKLTFYNRLAEIVGEYVRKGSQIYVEGRLRTRQYDKDGQTHYVTEVTVDNMQMLGSRGHQDSEAASRPAAAPRQPAAPAETGNDFQDDDIPF